MKAGSTVVRFKKPEPWAGPLTDEDQRIRLLHLVQEMGTPLNVVHGRMEYLLDRRLDRETRRSLTAILAQAKQLIALRQQLIDEVRKGREPAVSELPNGAAGSD
jgi:signal transduction histidine kinase